MSGQSKWGSLLWMLVCIHLLLLLALCLLCLLLILLIKIGQCGVRVLGDKSPVGNGARVESCCWEGTVSGFLVRVWNIMSGVAGSMAAKEDW